ncbi:hypothetical protein ACFLYF_00505 [Chloroflexota bacterium]
MIAFGILTPFFVAGVFMIIGLFVFPFDFGIFGPLERTMFPDGEPILKIRGSSGKIGAFRASFPLFTWYVYHSGLGISILGFGKVFIPKEQKKSLSEQKGLSSRMGRYKLTHNSPEIYDPVSFSDDRLFQTLEGIKLET